MHACNLGWLVLGLARSLSIQFTPKTLPSLGGGTCKSLLGSISLHEEAGRTILVQLLSSKWPFTFLPEFHRTNISKEDSELLVKHFIGEDYLHDLVFPLPLVIQEGNLYEAFAPYCLIYQPTVTYRGKAKRVDCRALKRLVHTYSEFIEYARILVKRIPSDMYIEVLITLSQYYKVLSPEILDENERLLLLVEFGGIIRMLSSFASNCNLTPLRELFWNTDDDAEESLRKLVFFRQEPSLQLEAPHAQVLRRLRAIRHAHPTISALWHAKLVLCIPSPESDSLGTSQPKVKKLFEKFLRQYNIENIPDSYFQLILSLVFKLNFKLTAYSLHIMKPRLLHLAYKFPDQRSYLDDPAASQRNWKNYLMYRHRFQSDWPEEIDDAHDFIYFFGSFVGRLRHNIPTVEALPHPISFSSGVLCTDLKCFLKQANVLLYGTNNSGWEAGYGEAPWPDFTKTSILETRARIRLLLASVANLGNYGALFKNKQAGTIFSLDPSNCEIKRVKKLIIGSNYHKFRVQIARHDTEMSVLSEKSIFTSFLIIFLCIYSYYVGW
ncbi:hypothetical protein PSACC_00472 [Paramicrosporidium saccamoebae]|uniref:Uncharacterized protein n=1 Tax=Paramicrosporidium saccamoebae TaxID=1246581 RepID=A0A2H9TPS3_9FUNG|nr:hypothetical protein PSACC_00472 [Paramicrosporidium saccamoebae]